jgi:hypothetical protein
LVLAAVALLLSLSHTQISTVLCDALPVSRHVQAEIKLRGGAHDGRTVWLDYEDFSRLTAK